MTPPEKLEYLKDDGLLTPGVGPWAEEKYSHINHYNELFSKSMKDEWDCRVYIDLFAGAGKSKIRGTSKILAASPLLALSVPCPYDKYIFCEKDKKLLQDLIERKKTEYPKANVTFVHGDCNERVDEICAAIPRPSRQRTVLSFCFIDPYNIDIHFNTVRRLSDYFMDFLIVLALGMDAQRNVLKYKKEEVLRVDRFLDDSNWREKWERAERKGITFRSFLAKEYASQMETLGYTGTSLETMKEMTSEDKNLKLYYLAFFSRHELGHKFWRVARKYGTKQQSFPF